MTNPVDETGYDGDVVDDQSVNDDLGELADPAQIAPDEGDVGADQ